MDDMTENEIRMLRQEVESLHADIEVLRRVIDRVVETQMLTMDAATANEEKGYVPAPDYKDPAVA